MDAAGSRTEVVALFDEHERAMNALLAFIEGWNEDTLNRTVLGDETTTYRHVLRHVAGAAYFGYFVWTQRVLDWEIVPPPVPDRESLKTINTLDELRTLLRDSTPYARRSLASLTNDHLGPAQHLSNWNAPYTIDQMLEHAIVHVWRHLRQLDRAERARL